jgi:murein DD-endopeptidase MepM/ murein hydrolase activator NlpD
VVKRPKHRKHSLGTAIVITRPKHLPACARPKVSVTSPDGKTKETFSWGKLPPSACPPKAEAPKKHHRNRKHERPGHAGTPANQHPGAITKPRSGPPAKSHSGARQKRPSGGVGLPTPRSAKPHPNGGTNPKTHIKPHGETPAEHLPAPVAQPSQPQTVWTAGFDLNPFTAAQLKQFSALVANLDQPPKFLVPIYKAAGKRYHIPWQILAAINAVETNYGQDLAVSPKGAVGWMQFMPGTWLEYGLAIGPRHRPNPYDPRDAIFSAARYLAASGAPSHIRQALFAYNHALWYVDAVLWRAQLISDHALGKRARKNGYALPLDARYMRQLGRTDDGVDIEDAPDGAAVYSITPGVVTAIASDPTGFGPDYPVVLVTSGPLAGQYIYYGHVAASLVHVGQRVSAGQPIAVMGHTGDAASLGHGHIEIGFSDGSGDPLNHHGTIAWTPSGDEMRQVLIALTKAFRAARIHPRPQLPVPIPKPGLFVTEPFWR